MDIGRRLIATAVGRVSKKSPPPVDVISAQSAWAWEGEISGDIPKTPTIFLSVRAVRGFRRFQPHRQTPTARTVITVILVILATRLAIPAIPAILAIPAFPAIPAAIVAIVAIVAISGNLSFSDVHARVVMFRPRPGPFVRNRSSATSRRLCRSQR